nr:DWNN domain-containing protein [Tanacetum cinerariifolium]
MMCMYCVIMHCREDSKTSIVEDMQHYELLVEALCRVWLSGLNHQRATYAIDARFMVGHFIQHCPTNGDPNFDIKRVIPPTGIPKSMLTATTDGVHARRMGLAAFEMETEGMLSTCNVSDLPEPNCPL